MKQITVAVCVDDKLGTFFAGHRQSRDRILIADLIQTAQKEPIYIRPFSRSLFPPDSDVVVCEDPMADCPPQGICFAEDFALLPHLSDIGHLILYHWNRHYPADRYFDLPLQEFTLCSQTEFAGSSHACIQKEVYKRI